MTPNLLCSILHDTEVHFKERSWLGSSCLLWVEEIESGCCTPSPKFPSPGGVAMSGHAGPTFH